MPETTATPKVTPAQVLRETKKLHKRVQAMIDARAAAIEQAQRLAEIVFKPGWPRFGQPINNEVDGIYSDLREGEVEPEHTLQEVNELLSLIELALRGDDARD